MTTRGRIALSLSAFLFFTTTSDARAERARYHYVVDASGTLTPAGGETCTLCGKKPVCDPPCPTCYQCYCHPCNGQKIRVPLALPPGTPTIEHGRGKIKFNYGSWFAEVQFLSDGSVDVIYCSGWLRAL